MTFVAEDNVVEEYKDHDEQIEDDSLGSLQEEQGACVAVVIVSK